MDAREHLDLAFISIKAELDHVPFRDYQDSLSVIASDSDEQRSQAYPEHSPAYSRSKNPTLFQSHR